MVWCRKVWKEIAAFRCETCPEAVEIHRQFVCGRQPGTEPDPKAIAESEHWGVLPSTRRDSTPSKGGAARSRTRITVKMREKKASDTAEPHENPASRPRPSQALPGPEAESRGKRSRRRPRTRRVGEAQIDDPPEAAQGPLGVEPLVNAGLSPSRECDGDRTAKAKSAATSRRRNPRSRRRKGKKPVDRTSGPGPSP